MKKKIRVDLELCVGHGRCYEIAPEVFAEDDDRGHCKVRLEHVEGDQARAAIRAADNCPEGAIFVEEDS